MYLRIFISNMNRTIKITEEQLRAVKNALKEGWQLNPNKSQFIGAYINKFRDKLNMPDLKVPQVHDALQSPFFNFRPEKKGYYRKDEIEYALGPGLGSLKRYFGVTNDNKKEEPGRIKEIPLELHNEINPDEYDEPEKSEMELASDELLKNDEISYPL